MNIKQRLIDDIYTTVIKKTTTLDKNTEKMFT